MAAVVFDLADFIGHFPHIGAAYEAGKLTEAAINDEWAAACSMLGGAGAGSPYPYDPDKGIITRKMLLYLAACHFLTLSLWPAGQPGRLTSASQGSVSSSFDLIKPGRFTGDWWAQTPCGARAWVMMQSYLRGGRVYAGKAAHPYG